MLTSLFPIGRMQLTDVLNSGYWHSRSADFLEGPVIKAVDWIRIVPDLAFILVGVVALLIAAFLTYVTLLPTAAKA